MEIQGKDVIFLISTDLVTPAWKEMICLEALSVAWATAVNKRKTRCGTKIGISPTEITVTGTTVADDAPSGSQVSHKEIEGWMNLGTQVLVKAAHATTPAKYFMSIAGYFTSNNEDFPTDDLFSFNWQFDGTGTVDLVP